MPTRSCAKARCRQGEILGHGCARIRSGKLQPGDRVPGISRMMQEFGIARTTAGKVLAVLKDEGLITVTPGWGSFVSQ